MRGFYDSPPAPTEIHMDAQLGITRRRFIATTTAAAAGFTIVPRHVLGGPGFVAPSDKVNVALIGAGGQGRTNARALFEEPTVALRSGKVLEWEAASATATNVAEAQAFIESSYRRG
jgi:hypothetical protein